jgi:hypothetical protein
MRASHALVLALCLPGCFGALEDGPAGPPGSCRGECVDLPSPTSQAARLSHRQWENATRDLLRLTEPSGAILLGDDESGLFDNAGGDLSVGSSLWQDYQRESERLAERVTTDPAALARVLPADLPTDATRTRAFLVAFGGRAYRRPLTDGELTAYLALFPDGATAYPEMDPFAAGVRIAIEAMLQSVNFLYRVELGSAAEGATIPLTDYEIASRLSFGLWSTMPDDELFDAAAAHMLTNDVGLGAQIDRMLADERARAMIVSFHDQLLGTSHYLDLSRSTTLFPEFDDALPGSMVGETEAFVSHVAFDDGGSLEALLTAPYTFVDQGLARVYGLSGTYGESFVRADLDPDERAGLLTQIGFLTSTATSTESDPIHRGVFLIRRVMCVDLQPPGMVAPLPAPMGPPETMRQRVEEHTSTCGAGCHDTRINPLGFAFEHFDALGRFRDVERVAGTDLPIDASASIELDNGELTYDGAAELARALADEPSVHDCYARHWLEYAYGRASTSIDDRIARRAGRRSRLEGLSVQGVIRELVTSPAFSERSTTPYEGPPLGETSP